MSNSSWREFIPKSYLYLSSNYSLLTFRKDLLAGITVGIIALPLAMAFAIASGVTPERGLFTAIIAGFLISALGGSRIQIGGPTGAFVVIIYDIVARNGYEGLAICTLIAAIFLIAMGLFGLGSWIKYIPYPLVTGFTTGIALIIFSSQIKDFFGLQLASIPSGFASKWIVYAKVFPTLQWPTFAVGAGTLALILLVRRFSPRIPWGISAIVFATLASFLLDLPVETIQSRFGSLPRTLPLPELPSLWIPAEKVQEYLFDALAIAFLGGIESLLSAVIGDGMIGGRHKSNCELVGQGIANIASVLFGGIPATGAIARTAANIKTGAQTPVAGMIHAITLFFVILLLGPIVSHIPLAALAAVLIMVAWNMSEMHSFIYYLKAGSGDALILLTAFLLTVFVDITFAITLGTILATFLFMKRMSESSSLIAVTHLFKEEKGEFPERFDPDALAYKNVPSDVEVYEINGPFFFGTADMLQDVLGNLHKPPKVFILRLRHVPFIDSSGVRALNEFYHRCQQAHIKLFLSGVRGPLAQELKRYHVNSLIGESSIFPNIDAALDGARSITKEV